MGYSLFYRGYFFQVATWRVMMALTDTEIRKAKSEISPGRAGGFIL